MIDIQVNIHDKFSLEFKVGFHARRKVKSNDFIMNTWIFIPDSLDVNSLTYPREHFYRDVRDNIRLITPIFLMRDIARGEMIPLKHLEASFNKVASYPSRSANSDYEYQIKMFAAIFKSSLRDQIKYIFTTAQVEDRGFLFDTLLDDVRETLSKYRALSTIIKTPTVSQESYNYFEFGDEFMSNIVDQQFSSLLARLETRDKVFAEGYREKIVSLIESENRYKREQGFPVVSLDSPDNNRSLVFRRGVLKKFVESDLFLTAKKKKDGVLVEQVYLSIAAGISMIFATAVAFSFQRTFGNLTVPLFVALVVSYMLKDRIKELMRYYFAHKRKAKYFDNKITVSIKDNIVGYSKEGFDFISEKRVPVEVLKIRNRSAMLEADNRYTKEKIILYRKLLQVDRPKLDESSKYFVAGINEIIRFSVQSYLGKMDNPETTLYATNNKGQLELTRGSKVYYLNFIIQLKYLDFESFKRYRIAFNRNGIKEVEEML